MNNDNMSMNIDKNGFTYTLPGGSPKPSGGKRICYENDLSNYHWNKYEMMRKFL